MRKWTRKQSEKREEKLSKNGNGDGEDEETRKYENVKKSLQRRRRNEKSTEKLSSDLGRMENVWRPGWRDDAWKKVRFVRLLPERLLTFQLHEERNHLVNNELTWLRSLSFSLPSTFTLVRIHSRSCNLGIMFPFMNKCELRKRRRRKGECGREWKSLAGST